MSDTGMLLVARLCAMAFALALARVAGVAAMGVFVISMTVTGVLAFALSLGINTNYSYFHIVRKWPISKLLTVSVSSIIPASVIGTGIWLIASYLVHRHLFQENISLDAVIFIGFAVPACLVEDHCRCLLQALNKIRRVALCSFATHGLPAVLAGAGYVYTDSLIGTAYGFVCGRLLSSSLHILILLWTIPFKFEWVAGWEYIDIIRCGLQSYLGGLASLANYRMDRLMVAALADPSVVGAYAIVARIAELGRMIPVAVQTSFMPKASAMSDFEAYYNAHRLMKMMVKTSIITSLCLIPIGTALMHFLQIREGQWYDLLIMCVGVVALASTAPLSAYNFSAGRPIRTTNGALAGLVTTVALGIPLISRFGLTGACVNSAIAYSVFGLTVLLQFLPGAARRIAD